MAKWFPIHLHYLPEGLSDIECVGAVICAEWNPARLLHYYGWKEPWPTAPGDRIMNFFRRWPDLASNTCLKSTEQIFFSIEGETDLGDLGRLQEMKDLGLSCIQLFHSFESIYFHPLHGLTTKGKALLQQMERLNLLLDLSHLSGARLDHVLSYFDGKSIVSHVVCLDEFPWSIVSRANAMSDNELKACGSVLYGIPFLDDLLSEQPTLRSSDRNVGINSVVNHIIRLANVVGIERVALGPDYFDYMMFAARGVEVGAICELDRTEGLELLWQGLCQKGLSEVELSDIFWRNATRVFSPTSIADNL